MRIGILSDIHGNLHALDAVLANVEAKQTDAIYCLGDLVGYGAFPNEVIERVRTRGIPTIIGNYDDGVGYDRDDCGCAYRDAGEQERGQRSLMWTRAHTTAENKTFLRGLVAEIRRDLDGRRLLLVHGSPRRMNEYLFEDRPLSSFQRLAASSNADIIVYGHTHRPYTKLVDGVRFINAGSVGKPKDGDRRAGYVILNANRDDDGQVEFVRLEYDVEAAARAIQLTELPGEFADDLRQTRVV